MKEYRGFVLSLGLLFTHAALAQGYPPQPTGDDVKSCDTHLKYKGKFINPHVIELFEGSQADTGEPIITRVDVAAAWDTNQFFDDDVTYAKDGAKYVTKSEQDSPSRTYKYQWIGRLADGTHVIETMSWGGGGSMVSTHLFLLRCSQGSGWRPHTGPDNQGVRLPESPTQVDEPYTRLNLTLERYFIIGDRVSAAYAIKGNTVTVTFPNQPKALPRVIRVDAK